MKEAKSTSLQMKIVALFLIAVVLPASSQTPELRQPAFAGPIFRSLRLHQSYDRLRRGGSIQFAIDPLLVSRSGQEIFIPSNAIDSSSGLMPTHLEIDPQPGFEIGPVVYPRAHKIRLSFSAQGVAAFKGEIPLRFSIRALPNASLGEHVFTGRLMTQVLDSQQAYAPQSIPVTFTLEIVGSKAKVRKTGDRLVSPSVTPGEIVLMIVSAPLVILGGIFTILIDCPFNGNCAS